MTQRPVHPDTRVVQRGQGRKAGQKALQRMWTFFIQAQHLGLLSVDHLHDLAQTRVPAARRRRPGMLTVVAWWRQHPIAGCPALMPLAPFKAGVSQIGTGGWGAHHRQARCGAGPGGQKRLSIRLLLGLRGCDRVARQHTRWRDSGEQVEAIVPAQAVRPARTSDAVEPVGRDATVVAHGHTHAVQRQPSAAPLTDVGSETAGGTKRAPRSHPG